MSDLVVDDRQAGASAGGPPLPGHGVRLGPADAQHPGRLLDGVQRRRRLLPHRHNPPLMPIPREHCIIMATAGWQWRYKQGAE